MQWFVFQIRRFQIEAWSGDRSRGHDQPKLQVGIDTVIVEIQSDVQWRDHDVVVRGDGHIDSAVPTKWRFNCPFNGEIGPARGLDVACGYLHMTLQRDCYNRFCLNCYLLHPISFCFSLCVSVCLSIRLWVCVSVRLSVCLSVSVFFSVCVSVCPPSPPFWLNVSLFLPLSLSLNYS